MVSISTYIALARTGHKRADGSRGQVTA